MPTLKGTKTHTNLKDAFAGESQANRRYLYFAKQADVEGYPGIAGNFRDTAEGETVTRRSSTISAGGRPGHRLPSRTRRTPLGLAGETHDTQLYRAWTIPRCRNSRDRRLVRALANPRTHAGRVQSLLKNS